MSCTFEAYLDNCAIRFTLSPTDQFPDYALETRGSLAGTTSDAVDVSSLYAFQNQIHAMHLLFAHALRTAYRTWNQTHVVQLRLLGTQELQRRFLARIEDTELAPTLIVRLIDQSSTHFSLVALASASVDLEVGLYLSGHKDICRAYQDRLPDWHGQLLPHELHRHADLIRAQIIQQINWRVLNHHRAHGLAY